MLSGETVDLSHDGRGVVKIDGKVYFVEGALPGEEVVFERLRRHRGHETGRLVEVTRPSADRVDPPCRYFGVCGGCALQHLSAEAQIDYKQRTLFDNLKRLGGVEPGHCRAPVSGPVTGYRRKARLGVRFVPKKGGVLVGFRERHKSYVTSLDSCLALHPAISALLPDLHGLVSGLSCRERLPQIEVAAGDGHTALVFRHLEPLTGEDLELLRGFEDRHGVDVYLQPAGLESVAALRPERARTLTYAPVEGIEIAFEPTDFIQVNARVNEVMARDVTELLEPGADDRLLELFCGVGNLSLPVARQIGSVVAVEGSPTLVERARRNAASNAIDNVEFLAGDLYAEDLAWLHRFRDCNKMLLDPPRSGALEVVRDVVPVVRPVLIVYVSCNPATLARDAGLLVNKEGYRLVTAGVMDMFPHTAHVESIAVFADSRAK